MKKNSKRRTVAYRSRTPPRTFAVLWFQVEFAEKIKSI